MLSTEEKERVGWKVDPWASAVGTSRATTYNLIAAGRIRSVKFGKSRIILTPPREFLESLADEAA